MRNMDHYCGSSHSTTEDEDDNEKIFNYEEQERGHREKSPEPRTEEGLTLSELLRTNKIDIPFRCTVCGKSFRTAGHLTFHEIIHIGEDPNTLETSQEEIPSMEETSSSKGHAKEQNNETTSGHQAYSEGSVQSSDREILTGEPAQENTPVDEPKNIRDVPQLRSFSSENTQSPLYSYCLNPGIEDIGEEIFLGDSVILCKKKKTTHDNPSGDQEQNGSEDMTKKCVVCSKPFPISDEPDRCEDCERDLDESSSSTSEQKSQDEERPFECDICGIRFRRVSALNCHMKTMHVAELYLKVVLGL